MSNEQKVEQLKSKHVFIYAEGHRMAADFAMANNLHPMNWTFLCSAEQLKGRKDILYIRVGDCFKGEKKKEIEIELKARNAKEVRLTFA